MTITYKPEVMVAITHWYETYDDPRHTKWEKLSSYLTVYDLYEKIINKTSNGVEFYKTIDNLLKGSPDLFESISK